MKRDSSVHVFYKNELPNGDRRLGQQRTIISKIYEIIPCGLRFTFMHKLVYSFSGNTVETKLIIEIYFEVIIIEIQQI